MCPNTECEALAEKFELQQSVRETVTWPNNIDLRNKYSIWEPIDSKNAQAFEDEMNNIVENFNKMVSELVESMANDDTTYPNLKIKFVDVNSALNKDTMMFDGIHPDATGYTAIANAYFNAINSYYTQDTDSGSGDSDSGDSGSGGTGSNVQENLASGLPSDFVSNGVINTQLYEKLDRTYTITKENDWKLEIKDLDDVDDNGNEYVYYVVEKGTLNGWNVSYAKNGQTAENDATITITNTKTTPKTSISIEKAWIDASSAQHNAVNVNLYRKSENETDWTLMTDKMASLSADNQWKYTWSELEKVNENEVNYLYRVEEVPIDGYRITYTNNDGINSNTAETPIKITNTKITSLILKKEWSDGDATSHSKVVVKLHRSTNQEDVPTNLPLIFTLDQTDVTVSVVGAPAVVTASNPIVSAESSASEIAEVAWVGKTITITGKSEGSATITVSDGTTTKTIQVTVNAAPVLNLTADPAINEIKAGETIQLTASLSDGSSTGKVTYKSSDTGIAEVDSNGKITGKNAGKATITATCDSNNECSASYDVEVSLNPFTLTSQGDVHSIAQGANLQLIPSPNYGSFEYKSANPDIATVDETGLVEGKSPGTTIITATRNGGPTDTATFEVTVTEGTVDIFTGSYTVNLSVGEVVTITANKDISNSWGNDASIATVVRNGRVLTITGKNEGSYQYTVQDSPYTGNYNITINVVGALSVTPVSKTLSYGGEVTLKANKSGVTYSIVDGSEFITLDSATGKVTAKSGSEGTAHIKATCGNEEVTVTIIVSEGASGSPNLPADSATISNEKSIDIPAGATPTALIVQFTRISGSGYFYYNINNSADGGNANVNNTSGEWEFLGGAFWGNLIKEDTIAITSSGETAIISFEFESGVTSIGLNPNGSTYQIKFVLTYKDSSGTENYVVYPEATVTAQDTPQSASYMIPLMMAANEPEEIEGPLFENGVATLEINGNEDADGKWMLTVENLDIYDENGNVYYYWIEEESVPGYAPTYSFKGDSVADTEYCVKADSLNQNGPHMEIMNTKKESTGVTMPSTGGGGTAKYYYTGGAMVLLSVLAGSNRIRRRLRERRER